MSHRIGLVSPYDWATVGGVNAHVAHLAERLRGLGNDVAIIAPSSLPEGHPANAGVHVVGRPYPVPANASIARIPISFRLAAPVRAIMEEGGFDVVHVHEPLQGPLAMSALRAAQGVRVGTFHAYSGSRMSTGSMAYYYGKGILQRWFRLLDGKIAVSAAAAAYVGEHFPGYYNIIPNGVSLDEFNPGVPRPPRATPSEFRIVFLGRMEQRKGLRFLLRAFQILKPLVPGARLIIAGGGARQRAGYELWVRNAGLEGVAFLGFIPESEKPALLRSADVFVAPNTGDESFGIALVEAMACGAPVIASNIRAFADIVTPGVEGELVPPKNPDRLADALLAMARSSSRREEYGANAALRAREFSWDRVARRVLAYYDRLVFETRPRGRSPRPVAGSEA